MLCQKYTSEKLCCPAESQRSNVGSGCQTLADNLLTFSKIGCLPKTLDLSKLDDGEGFQATVEHHRARLSCLPDFTSKRRALDGLSRLQLVFCMSFDRNVTSNTVTRWMRDELQCQ